jgi:tRNA nucleotidyltransferase (CCA-adding enzyme)
MLPSIQANPDQSKHLETATVKVGRLEVDITNLRTETYNSGSRIPEVRVGTAQEDALRRDLTINALFYNLMTTKVEDCTGMGWPDLQRGLCRTPLPARETFLDDPLRLLRAVRFAVRFGFDLDASILAAAREPALRDALAKKVCGFDAPCFLPLKHPPRYI